MQLKLLNRLKHVERRYRTDNEPFYDKKDLIVKKNYTKRIRNTAQDQTS